MKINYFTKILGLLIMSVLLFFGIQFVVRSLYFDEVYVQRVVDRNIEIIDEVTDRVNNGEDVYMILDELEVTDLQLLDYYVEDIYEYYSEDFVAGSEGLFGEENYLVTEDKYYVVVEDEYGYDNSTYHIYAAELEDGSYIIFEQYLTGLTDANTVLTQIDVYILLIVLLIFIPISVWFSSRTSKPLRMMKQQARELSNLEFNEPLNIRTNDEIEELSKSINLVSLKLKRAIDDLKDDVEKERIKERKNRELIASLSHELKTPLTTMRGVLEGMIDHVGVYKDKEKYLKETLKYVGYMEYLSKDLIDVVGYETKKPQRLIHNFSQVVEGALDYVDSEQVTLDIEDSIVLCNEDMIRRVLINLITNGMKYSPDNKVTVRSTRTDKLQVDIINKGSIPETEMEKVFEPFYRLEKSRNKATGGSGLGLFIVKSILEAHEVAYSIKNVEDEVVFTFTLDTDTTLTKV